MAPIKLTEKDLEWDPERTRQARERLRGKTPRVSVVPYERVNPPKNQEIWIPAVEPPAPKKPGRQPAPPKYSATEKAVETLVAEYPSKAVPFKLIEDEACDFFDVSLAAVRRDMKDPVHTFVRKLRYFLAKQLIQDITYFQIATLVGLKSPERVSVGVQHIRGLLDNGQVRQRKVLELVRIILEKSPETAP